VPVRRVEQALLVAQLLDLVLQRFAVRLLGLVQRFYIRGPQTKVDLVALSESEFIDDDVHTDSLFLAGGIAARLCARVCGAWCTA